jgi:hypothetical protein
MKRLEDTVWITRWLANFARRRTGTRGFS